MRLSLFKKKWYVWLVIALGMAASGCSSGPSQKKEENNAAATPLKVELT